MSDATAIVLSRVKAGHTYACPRRHSATHSRCGPNRVLATANGSTRACIQMDQTSP